MNAWLDVKYAARLLRKSWGYSLMCATVVALSVGVTVWTYSLAYSQLLRPLGFPGSERWYSIQIATKAGARAQPFVDAYTYQEILKQTRSADHLGAFYRYGVVLSEGQASVRLRAAGYTPRLFAATGEAPILGRVFQDADAQAGAAPVAILSFNTWQNYFAAARDIVGKTARIDSGPVQIIGVMPEDFYAFRDSEIWLPLQMPQLTRPSDSKVVLSPMVLLKDGQNVNTVLNEIEAAVAKVNAGDPQEFNSTRSAALIPGLRMFTHTETPIIVMLSFMSAAVLLLGCVNISMVFLARLLERSRELALRVAVGSSRGRLMRQCLLETALIVVLGLLIGYGLAFVGVRWTQGLSDLAARIDGTGRASNMLELRPIDFLAAVACAIAIWLLSTLIPAWRIAKQDAAVTLAAGGKGTSVRSGNKSVGLLVALQVVISCLVLVICANLVLAVRKEVSKPVGLDTAGVVITTDPTVFDSRYAQSSERLRYWQELAASIRGKIPGAEVAFTTAVPTRPASVPVTIETQQGTANQGTLTLPLAVVSESYFELLGLTLRSGRLFDATDDAASLQVAVVDENTASRYWPDDNAVGKRVRVDPATEGPWLTIVGVVSGVSDGPYRPKAGVLYRPLRQAIPSEFRLLARTPNPAVDSRDALRAAAFAVDRDLPLHNLQTLDDYMGVLNLMATALVPVVVAVALITALLAASGLFGLISRSVAQRTQEVGIRRALGATPRRATSMFMRQGAVYLAVAVIGVALGIMLMPPLSTAIHNIFDFVILATLGVVVLMAVVISFASYLPTRRALALEPGDALRYE